MAAVQKLSKFQLIIFSLGQMGWSLSLFCISSLLTYFYLPPVAADGNSLFATHIYQGAVVGVLTLIGVINFGSRIFDAITDPLLASWSDRSKASMGRRNSFLFFSSVPVAVLGSLCFLPPIATESHWNFISLLVCTLLYYFAITAYCTPYNALISEYGHTAKERLNMATTVSVTWALGFMLGNQVYLFQGLLQGMFPTWNAKECFQIVVIAFQLLAMVLMLLPSILIKESKHARSTVSEEKLLDSVKMTFANKNFRFFLGFDFCYWLSVSFIQLGISFYIISLLGQPAEWVSHHMTALFLLSFVFYYPVNVLSTKLGKMRVIKIAFVIFALCFTCISLLGLLPIAKMAQSVLIVVLSAIPMAVFGILPTALVADMADGDLQESGVSRAGMYFATRTFTMKLGISVANLLFPSLLLLGRGGASSLGIRLSAVLALIFCVMGLMLSRYCQENLQSD